jgi:hypothetical protein
LPALNYALMAPFGELVCAISGEQAKISDAKMEFLFENTLDAVSRVFLFFGARWLAKEKPQQREVQVNLLSTGIIRLLDVIVAETSRLVGFTGGHFGVSAEVIKDGHPRQWREIASDVGVKFMERVVKDWELLEKDN